MAVRLGPRQSPSVQLRLPPELARVLSDTPGLDRAYLVGGCVRDSLLGIAVKDYDIEVFGLGYEDLTKTLSRWGRTDLVGRSFGVIKLTLHGGATFDFSIPRRDRKVASGHRGFDVAFDPTITLEEAAARRDYTLNALMFDPRRNEVLDFFGGRRDLENKILRHTSEAFAEDPLRVLRGMQFAARFDLHAAADTVALCRRIKSSYRELPVERVREEWFKWASKSVVPSRGLRFLVETEWVEHFPEVRALIGTPQDAEWHPEGDVFVHTCHCCDALVKLPAWPAVEEESRVVYMLAVLAHDFAKPQTTREELKHGRLCVVSPGHEEAGGPLAEQFLTRINAPNAVRERVLPLVTNHLAHQQSLTDRAVRRLARRLAPETIEGLCVVIAADQAGRPPKPAAPSESLLNLQAKAAELEVHARAPHPILLGRHLLELGLKPGKPVGVIVREAFEAQLEGKFTDLLGALEWVFAQPQLPLTPSVRARLQEHLAVAAAESPLQE
ncbi:MAG: polynucleotide adenylyltransferase [Verrucomicrobia bacterium]|nr:polynucleotide adenylyltransferase [Verrucomicrobiota bacterium]